MTLSNSDDVGDSDVDDIVLSNIFSISKIDTIVKMIEIQSLKFNGLICHRYLNGDSDIGAFLESSTQTVSNIRRQHRCSLKKVTNSFVANIARCQKTPFDFTNLWSSI